MSKRYDHVLALVRRQPWAIHTDTPEWASILDVLAMRRRGETLSDEDIAERVSVVRAARGERRGARSADGIGVVPLYGPIVPRADLMTEMSGATSVQGFLRDLRSMATDPEIGTIVLDVDSPGGMVDMIPEAAAEMRRIRAEKPIVAVADTMTASAAYWLSAQASEVVASPSSVVGSIGVLTLHEDWSGAYEKAGVKPTLIRAGKYKAEANEFEPLSDEARAKLQGDIDQYHDMFVGDVAKGRGVKASAVRSGYGEGRILTAKDALAAGMVDRVATLDETIARVTKSPPAPGRASAVTVAYEGTAEVMAEIADDDSRYAFERELYERRPVPR